MHLCKLFLCFIAGVREIIFPGDEEDGELYDQHGNPTDQLCERDRYNAQLQYKDERSSPQAPADHIDRAREQSHFHLSHASKESLYTIGESREQIHDGNQFQVGDALRYDGLIMCEHLHNGRGCDITDDHHKKSIDDFKDHAALESISDALCLAGPVVLCHECSGGMTDILLRCKGKIIDSIDSGNGSDHAGSHSVDHRLHDDFAQRNDGLLQCSRPAVADSLAKQRAVENEPVFAKAKQFYSFLDIDAAQETAD